MTGLLVTAHPPASKHGEVIQALHTTFLYRHSPTNHHPALGLIRRDTDRFIRRDASQPAHILDILRRLILIGRCPLADNHPDRIEPVLMIIIAEKEHMLEMEYFPKVVEDILKTL